MSPCISFHWLLGGALSEDGCARSLSASITEVPLIVSGVGTCQWCLMGLNLGQPCTSRRQGTFWDEGFVGGSLSLSFPWESCLVVGSIFPTLPLQDPYFPLLGVSARITSRDLLGFTPISGLWHVLEISLTSHFSLPCSPYV